MTKQRILFITTGGTIASVHTPQGLRPVLSSDELLAHLPELNDLCIPETLALCSIDSTDLGQEHWLMMARAIQENYALYDGFIICHGTDTLAYSAAAKGCFLRPGHRSFAEKGVYYKKSFRCSGCGEAARYDPIRKLKIMFPLIMARAKRRPF